MARALLGFGSQTRIREKLRRGRNTTTNIANNALRWLANPIASPRVRWRILIGFWLKESVCDKSLIVGRECLLINSVFATERRSRATGRGVRSGNDGSIFQLVSQMFSSAAKLLIDRKSQEGASREMTPKRRPTHWHRVPSREAFLG
jgi:hypothetical protein